MDTPLIRTLSMALLLSKSMRFNCIFGCQFPVSLGCGFGHVHSDKIRSLSKRSYVFKTKYIAHLSEVPNVNFWKIRLLLACLFWDFQTSRNGIIAHFYGIFTLKRSPRIFGRLFSGWNFWKVLIPIIFESLDLQLGNPNRWKIFRG